MKTFTSSAAVFTILLVTSCTEPEARPPRPGQYEWEHVKRAGILQSVYVQPEGIDDRAFTKALLRHLCWDAHAAQITIHDDLSATPKAYPMTDKQMHAWRASYSFNRSSGEDRYVRVIITDWDASPPQIKEYPTSLRRVMR